MPDRSVPSNAPDRRSPPPPAATDDQDVVRFARQGIWMTLATVLGGASFALVHKIAPYLKEGDYSAFATLLQIANSVTLAAAGFQAVLAKAGAESLTESRRRDTGAAARRVLLMAFGLWALLAIAIEGGSGSLRHATGVSDGWAWIWLAAACLSLLWQYSLQGVLQGAQDFRWLGLILIGSGLGRLVLVWILVVLLQQGVSGALAGVFGAAALCVVAALWRTWPDVTRTGGTCHWGRLIGRCAVLIAGMGALSLLLSLDQIASRRFLPAAQLDLYAAAGTIGRVVVLITVPLTTVMFPKVARSIATETRPAAFFQALMMVGLVGVAAAVFCTLFPELPIRLLQGPRFVEAAGLVPAFAWSVLPLTLATVLANNLFARGRYGVIPPLAALAIGYHFYLESHHQNAREIIHALFLFASAACVLCAAACWSAGLRPALPRSRRKEQ